MFPALVISPSPRYLGRMLALKGVPVFEVEDRDSLFDFIQSVTGLVRRRPVAVLDLADVTRYVTALVPLLERNSCPLVLLSSTDLPFSVQSRCLSIRRTALEIRHFQNEVRRFSEEAFAEGVDMITLLTQRCPSLFVAHQLCSHSGCGDVVQEKMLRLIAGG